MPEICLQINLCPGDVAYAEIIVPRLLTQHAQGISHRMLIVDTNKPLRTHANQRDYPEPDFSEKAEQIRKIAQQFKSDGLVDQIVELNGEQSELQEHLSQKFTSGWIPPHVTHDYHGAAYLAYLAALDLCPTRFLLHYDADILLHQRSGVDWALEALDYWESLPNVISSTPRISPPGHIPDAPSLHQGRPFYGCPGGWLDDWFSTRCFLMDIHRLSHYLPLVRGRYTLEVLFYRLLKRRYPPAPEILLFQSARPHGARRLNLSEPAAWILHPTEKPARFIELLPQLVSSIEKGSFPSEQTGQSEINLPAWENHLS